jgi:hypothetical protein
MKGRGHKKREGGGRLDMKVSGNPDVFKEAEGKEPYDKGDERKRGGKVKKHDMHPEGKMARHRHDRPARRSGGRVGADKNPLSSAHHSGKTGERAAGQPD